MKNELNYSIFNSSSTTRKGNSNSTILLIKLYFSEFLLNVSKDHYFINVDEVGFYQRLKAKLYLFLLKSI